MALLSEAKANLGELLIMGFSGLELSDNTATFISQAQIGGVILFSQNYETPAQLAELCNQIQDHRPKNTNLPLWISTDQEGGRVQRFKRPFTRIPEAMAIGNSNSPQLAFEISEIIAQELKSVGVNINFCPVADIQTNPKNPVIGTRAYGNHEERVSKMVSAIVRGHLVQGVQPCVKHFPGHGDTSSDSHLALPKVDTPLDVLQEQEFKPFIRAFKSRCSLVMTAHILLPKIDPELPATLSPRILQDILRKTLRYSKIIISDDLEMKAITDHFGADEVPRLAILAGCDLLIYRSERAARQAYANLMSDLEKGLLPAERVLESVQRSQNLKREMLLPYSPIVIAEMSKKIGLPKSQAIVQPLLA